MTKPILTAERLRELLHYNPETGIFTALIKRKMVNVGDVAGTPNGHGHLAVGLDGRRYYAHILAWLYMTGEWPARDIDHRDTDPGNNRWGNLREATESQNTANARLSRRNTSGFKGVSLRKRTGKFQANIRVDRKLEFLGYFDTPEAASAAYARRAQEVFGAFARP